MGFRSRNQRAEQSCHSDRSRSERDGAAEEPAFHGGSSAPPL